MSAIKANPGVDTDSASSSRKKTESPSKNTTPKKKGQYSLDLDSLQRVIKKLSNEIIDLKKGTS